MKPQGSRNYEAACSTNRDKFELLKGVSFITTTAASSGTCGVLNLNQIFFNFNDKNIDRQWCMSTPTSQGGFKKVLNAPRLLLQLEKKDGKYNLHLRDLVKDASDLSRTGYCQGSRLD